MEERPSNNRKQDVLAHQRTVGKEILHDLMIRNRKEFPSYGLSEHFPA